ncbi:MAG TPA: OsmC family protein [Pyrinomonadaceae bacterium]|jgi:putative redox protein|nr:OsmC family protein [Pyrinomonadaceae bacterium]
MAQDDKKAVVKNAGDEFFIAISPSGHAITLDTRSDRAAAPSPMELLLMALGSCTAVDVIGILEKKREQVTDYRVEVRGERRAEYPRSFKRMEVRHIVTGKAVSEKAVAQAIELSSNKYCSVAATLRPTAEIVSSYEIIEATE